MVKMLTGLFQTTADTQLADCGWRATRTHTRGLASRKRPTGLPISHRGRSGNRGPGLARPTGVSAGQEPRLGLAFPGGEHHWVFSPHTPGSQGEAEIEAWTKERGPLLLQCPFSALSHKLHSMPDGKGEMFTGPTFIITESGIEGCI